MKKEVCANCTIKSKAVGTLNEEELEILNDNCAEIRLSEGEYIIREETPASHIAYLKSGLVKIHMTGPRGYDQILKIATSGTYLGLQTLSSQKIHRFSVTALEPSVVCFIDVQSFRHLISRNASFAYEVIVCLCQDEMNYFDRFVNLSQKQVNGRLADAILQFSNDVYHSHSFQLPLSRGDLAALIGSTRESVSRAIKELSDTSVIKSDGKKIEIINPGLLERISQKG